MRVLLISHWFPPIISGSSYYASNLAQTLRARGHEVIVVTLDWGEDYAPETDLNLSVYRLPVIKIPRLSLFYNLQRMGFAFTPKNYKRLSELIRKHNPQIIHCVNHIFDTNFLATLIGKKSHIPVIGSITTPVQHENKWIQKLYHLADFSTIGFFGVQKWDGIVSLDQTVHSYVGHVYGSKTQQHSRVIPFGVRLESMAQYENKSVLRSERPQILMVGHIHPFRNPSQLVRAMPLILKTSPNARLILAGRVDLQEPLKVSRELGLSNKQVQFLGETLHQDTVDLMKKSHVLASWATGPYRSLGTAPLEAMLCETPVVSDLPQNLFGECGPKHGENILLVDSKNPESIADGIVSLLKDEKRREQIGKAGRRFVLDYLNWECIILQIEKFYKDVLEKRRKAETLTMASRH